MNILFILVALILVLVIVSHIYRRYWPAGIKASVAFSNDRAVEGDTAELCQVIEYTGKLPLPWVRVKFQISKDIIVPHTTGGTVTDRYTRMDIFRVGRNEKVTRRLPVECPKRGQHRIFGVDVVSSDPFNLHNLVASFAGNNGITVYPRRTEIPELIDAAHRMMGEHVVRRSRMEDPFIFRGVREYVPGDQLSHINWRVTARSDELAVNQYEYTSDLCVSIWLGIEEHEDARDYELCEESIRIAATLLGTFIDEGVPTSLCCNAPDCFTGKVFGVGHGCSQEHKDICLTALARLDIEKDAMSMTDYVRTVPHTSGDNELIIVVSPKTGRALCEEVVRSAAGREIFWIVPVRSEEEQQLPGLDLIKNSCVWRVNCER